MHRLISILAALVLAAGLSLVSTPAHAVVGAGKVRNMYGNSVLVRCDYSSSTSATPYDGRLHEYASGNGKGAKAPYMWHSDQVKHPLCYSDTDQFRAEWDDRCIYYKGAGYTDGYYKLEANKWRKVSDLATVSVYSMGYGSPDKCAGRPWYTRN